MGDFTLKYKSSGKIIPTNHMLTLSCEGNDLSEFDNKVQL